MVKAHEFSWDMCSIRHTLQRKKYHSSKNLNLIFIFDTSVIIYQILRRLISSTFEQFFLFYILTQVSIVDKDLIETSLGKISLINKFGGISFNLHNQFSSVSHSAMSDSLWPHGLQHTRLPCPSPTSRAYSNSCQSHQWCHPTILSSVVPFSSRL